MSIRVNKVFHKLLNQLWYIFFRLCEIFYLSSALVISVNNLNIFPCFYRRWRTGYNQHTVRRRSLRHRARIARNVPTTLTVPVRNGDLCHADIPGTLSTHACCVLRQQAAAHAHSDESFQGDTARDMSQTSSALMMTRVWKVLSFYFFMERNSSSIHHKWQWNLHVLKERKYKPTWNLSKDVRILIISNTECVLKLFSSTFVCTNILNVNFIRVPTFRHTRKWWPRQ